MYLLIKISIYLITFIIFFKVINQFLLNNYDYFLFLFFKNYIVNN